MKVLHVVSTYKPAFIYGGPIMSISKMCELLAQRTNVEIKLLTTDANGTGRLSVQYGKETEVDGLTVIYFKRVTGDPHEVSPTLWNYLYRHAKEFDVVHIHAWWNFLAVFAAFICFIKKTKYIISPRGMLSGYIFEAKNSEQKKWLQRIVGKRVLTHSFFHATSGQEFLECKRLIPGWEGFLIPNIIELPKLVIEKKANQVFTLGFLSRIDPKKGLEFVFEAIAQLNFPIALRIAGAGEDSYIQSLEKLSSDLRIDDKIEWVGWLNPEQKFTELMGLDLFVLSSFNENFANVVVEALHVSTPVCISRFVGLAEFVEREELGWLTDLNVGSVRQAIENAYYNITKRQTISERAHNIIAETFSAEKITAEYIDMYTKVIQAPSLFR